jgi:hypothetical protein
MLNDILKEAKWIGKISQADSESWLDKEVEHTTPTGKRTKVKVKSLPPEEREKYRPKRDDKKLDDLIQNKKKTLEEPTKPKTQRHQDLEKSTGNNYTDVNLKTLQGNIDNNLKKYDNDKIQTKTISSKDPLTSKNWLQHKTAINDNAKTVIKKYAKAMSPDSQRILSDEVDRITSHIEKGLNDGSLKTSPDKIDSLIQENMKLMIHQEVETKRRMLGDHGIRHIISNSKNTNTMLDELEKGGIKVSGAERLASSFAQMNHDIGYTLGAAATNVMSPPSVHKEQSDKIFNENRSRYEEVLGKDLTDKTHNWISTHDDINFDWKNDPVASSIRFADTMSLFGEDKLPEMFLKSGKTTKILTKMKIASQMGYDLKPYKEELRKSIDTLEGDDIQKEELKNSVDEISAYGVDDFLSRYSGKLKGFKYNKGTGAMEADISQSPEHELIQSMFSVGQKKFKSLDGDLSKRSKPEFVNGDRNSKMYKNEDGFPVVQINMTGKDKDPINQITNDELKSFYSKSIRHHVNKIKNDLSIPPKLDHTNAKKSIKDVADKLEEPHKKLMNRIGDVYLKSVKDSKLDQIPEENWDDKQKIRMKRLNNLFNRFPLTKSEQEWMQSKVAMKIAQSDSIKKKIEKAKSLIKNIEKVIKNNNGKVKVELRDDEKKLGYGSDSDYYIVAIFKIKTDWLPVDEIDLIVTEKGDIILRIGDVSEIYWVGHWSGELLDKEIISKFNKG